MRKRLISKLFCSLLLLGSSALVSAQDTSKVALPATTPLAKSKKFSLPNRYIVGLDIIKIARLPFDSARQALDFFAEAPLKKNVWLTANLGWSNSKFQNDKVKFNSSATAVSLQISQAFFPFNFLKDDDNAFAGLGYGLSLAKAGKAEYTIVDPWGTYTGALNARSKFVHWVEISAGFRMQITRHFMAGWRIQGKSAINPNAFRGSVTPSYIALYGTGDKSTNFNYNLMLGYRFLRN